MMVSINVDFCLQKLIGYHSNVHSAVAAPGVTPKGGDKIPRQGAEIMTLNFRTTITHISYAFNVV